jgi:hypothetical protein
MQHHVVYLGTVRFKDLKKELVYKQDSNNPNYLNDYRINHFGYGIKSASKKKSRQMETVTLIISSVYLREMA